MGLNVNPQISASRAVGNIVGEFLRNRDEGAGSERAPKVDRR